MCSNYDVISSVFEEVKSHIQIISVMEDAVQTPYKYRTKEQIQELGKNMPMQLLEKIEKFKEEREHIYQFSKFPEDEFWIVSDIDDNLIPEKIADFHRTLDLCDEDGYFYALSNPFFEVWLLLHHDDVNDEDKSFAVTSAHPYERTGHFRDRMRELDAPLKEQKHIRKTDYDKRKIMAAIDRAKALDADRERYPAAIGSTVYRLIEKMTALLPEE